MSLSKVYGLISRFSEDIDIAVLIEGLSSNQIKLDHYTLA